MSDPNPSLTRLQFDEIADGLCLCSTLPAFTLSASEFLAENLPVSKMTLAEVNLWADNVNYFAPEG